MERPHPSSHKNLLFANPSATNPLTVFDVAEVLPAKEPLEEVSYYTAIETLLKIGQTQKRLDYLLQDKEELTKAGKFTGLRALACDNEIERLLIKIETETKTRIESCSQYQGRGKLVDSLHFHPLVQAFHNAYNDHRPLCLSPDMIWLLIAQGLANHINANAEQLRYKFVKHEGKVKIIVERDDFIKGSPKNPWEEVFAKFSSEIRKHIGETTHDLLTPNFSTSGVVEKAASEIVLMDAMQSYFEYKVVTLCGIPQIKLEGTLDDWQNLLKRTQNLAQYELDWWINSLIPILEQFIAAVEGKPDKEFWQSAYKMNYPGSGSSYITGWITDFFPYLKDYQTGKASRKNFKSDREITTDDFPSGLAKAPFIWDYNCHIYNMEFLAGFVGIKQDLNDLSLRPEIAWVILEIESPDLK